MIYPNTYTAYIPTSLSSSYSLYSHNMLHPHYIHQTCKSVCSSPFFQVKTPICTTAGMLHSLHSSKVLKHPVVFAQPCVTLTAGISTHQSCTYTANPTFPQSALKLPRSHNSHPNFSKYQTLATIKILSLRQQKSYLCFWARSPIYPRENSPIGVTLHTWHLGTKTTAILLYFHRMTKYHIPITSLMILLHADARSSAWYCAGRRQAGAFAVSCVLPPFLRDQTQVLISSLLSNVNF